MASLLAIKNVARRHVVRLVQRTTNTTTQKRSMSLGEHHGPPPDWQGIDKVVRSYFPEDYKLAIAILSGYVGLYYVVKIVSWATSSKKPAVEAAPVAAPQVVSTTGSKSDDMIPEVDSPAFDAFIESIAFETLLESDDKLEKNIV